MRGTDWLDSIPGRRWIGALRTRIGSVLPGFLRRNLIVKLVIILLLGTLISGLVVAVLYDGIDDGLTDQVKSQIQTDARLHADMYDQWLNDQWTTLNSASSEEEIFSDNRPELDSWASEIARGLDDTVASVYVVDQKTGEIVGSAPTKDHGVNLYDQGLSPDSMQGRVSISEPLQLPGEETNMTLIVGTGVGTRFLVAAVPSNVSLVPTQGYDGAKTTLRTLDGQHLLGPADEETQEFVSDIETNASRVQTTDIGGTIVMSRTLAHSRTSGFSQDSYESNTTIGTVVVHTVPESNALAFRDRISSDILFAFGVTFVLLIGTAIVSMRSVTSAIDDLSGRTQQISEGDFDVDVSSDRADEIGTLYRSIREMRDSLSERIEEAQTAKKEAETAREDAEQARKDAEQARQEAERVNERLERKAKEYSDVLTAFAEGDLTVRMNTDTENPALIRIADSFNGMAADLEETIVHIREFASEVDESSDRLSKSAAEIKRTSDDVSRSIQQTAEDAERQNEDIQRASDRVMDQSASIEEVAASVNEAATQSQRTAELSSDGQEYTDRTTNEMAAIEERTEEMVSEIEQLDEEVGAIGDIVGLIEDIAEQTNMLALNASIEAARAGEAGEGFAVVADEIKSLSEETQNATNEIEDLVDRAQESTDEVVTDIQGMREGVETGIETVDQTVDIFEEIATAVEDVDQTIQSISDAVDDQATAAEEIETLVQDIGEVSESTTANATEVAASVQEQTSAVSEISEQIQGLSEQARTLQEMTDEFDVEETPTETVQDDSVESAERSE
jgi:methyl-accepting chemotaxis protein